MEYAEEVCWSFCDNGPIKSCRLANFSEPLPKPLESEQRRLWNIDLVGQITSLFIVRPSSSDRGAPEAEDKTL